jgi:steroid delta-isomerase-like uncharacterized protein
MDDSITKRFVDAWNSHDGARVADLCAVDVTYEDVAMGRVCIGHDDLKAFVKDSGTDLRFLTLSEQSSNDQYAVEWECEGLHTGSMPGFPATNKPFRFRGASIGRLDADGTIVENRDYWNLADFMAQVGLPPAAS